MAQVVYLGDTNLTGAAAYLAGLMHRWDWQVTYRPSHETVDRSILDLDPDVFILSDYPAHRMSREVADQLVKRVEHGAGLIMIGGWESYHGLGGDWDGTAIADALPVVMRTEDDRLNCDQVVLVQCVEERAGHPAVAGLPWEDRPPVIGGFNLFEPRDDAAVLLEAHRHRAQWVGQAFAFAHAERYPLLVVGAHGEGYTAALATDVAPHWIGPMVDWGTPRVQAQAPGGGPVEVGSHYATFLHQLIAWAGRFS